MMKRHGIEVTQENYLDLAYCGDVRDPWGAELEANLSPKLQDWWQLRQAHLGRDALNLVHPGKAARSGTSFSKATALTVLAAVYRVIGDFK